MAGSPPRGWSLYHHCPAFPWLENSISDKTALIGEHMEERPSHWSEVTLCDCTQFWTLSEFMASVKNTCMNTNRHAQMQTLHAWIYSFSSSINWRVDWVHRTQKVKLTMNFKIKYNVHDICEVSSNYELGKFSQLDREKLFYFFFHFGDLGPCLDHSNPGVESS